MSYSPSHHIRIVTAASLFDGHDAAINIMRRILQSQGVEVIHLGHNRSAADIVEAAIEEDVQAIALTSYQGGHIEYFKYIYDLLREKDCGHIKIFGGGGGTILPEEVRELQDYGITRIYSPDDGRKMGLVGMIEDVIRQADFAVPIAEKTVVKKLADRDPHAIATAISILENGYEGKDALLRWLNTHALDNAVVLGITGVGGSGKSTVTDELIRRFLQWEEDRCVAVISVDPSKKKTGGALLGDRIRMNVLPHPRVYMRSMATRQSEKSLSTFAKEALAVCKAAKFDLIILESSGIGQADTSILDHCDLSLYVMTPEYGAATQLEKINMIDYADVIAINKFDKNGAQDALRDVKKQYQREHGLWTAKMEEMPVIGTIASQFNDQGMNDLFVILMKKLKEKGLESESEIPESSHVNTLTHSQIIPPARVRYLAEITETIYEREKWIDRQCAIARQLYQAKGVLDFCRREDKKSITRLVEEKEKALAPECLALLQAWEAVKGKYQAEYFEYSVRDKTIRLPLYVETLSHSKIPKIALPQYTDWGAILRWLLKENLPGQYPFTGGVFPLKRQGEDPTRMFAGEGGPERTNRRFHYISGAQPAKRLSTAFDSVTLYGHDPEKRPDVYGKIGNAGVSIATVDDAKKLYSGFDLCAPSTSVSMTINGPAPVILALFFNAAIDQQCEKYITKNGLWNEVNAKIKKKYRDIPRPEYDERKAPLPEMNNGLGLRLLGVSGDEVLDKAVYEQIKKETLHIVRGTVQADILKEDQAQNTCIFSTAFSLKMMGDIQAYFIQNKIQNFYSVSISGYHIAEAGANPITQLAFTLANGFTYVEYYLSRGMNIDEFVPNLSFFFSNGMDAEYAVIGRVARRIWARAMKDKYGAGERAQKLKYHIQTSGRSLHAQEISFNDIRTTLQALYAIYDNCNSLHTNAYDEAVTTPTEESVRRAIAIQMIINKELGTAKNENPNQGSFLIEALTDLVEEAVLAEFKRISERGGVLGAMERMYQRNKIQEESLDYESRKNSGELPIVGVNTFLNKEGSPTVLPKGVFRSSAHEKKVQIKNVEAFRKRNAGQSIDMLRKLQETAIANGNIFEELMETVKYCSLGEITNALFNVGGQYRRNM